MEAKNRWQGLRPQAQERLQARDYSALSTAEQLAGPGIDAGALLDRSDFEKVWIPGVEVFPRRVFQQHGRGFFGEFAREGEGLAGQIGFWPKQWASALMHAESAKGFHMV